MINVQKKQIKSIEDYRHSIKLLKYHLKKQTKHNDKLQYEAAKLKYKKPVHSGASHTSRIYSLSDTVKTISNRLKRMGLVLGDLFRMADDSYEGEITKEQFMKTAYRLKTDLEESLFTQMYYAIDNNLNGLVSEEQFLEFSIAYGGCTDAKEIRKYEKKIKSKLASLILKNHGSIQNFITKYEDPIPSSKFSSEIKKLGLSDSEAMLMLKTFDPSQDGNVKHKVFITLMESVKAKTEKQQKEEQYEKGIQELCAAWRDKKLNPIDIFEEADVDGVEGVSTFELQQAFKKLMPAETNYQIKKWVAMINLNNDTVVTKEEFLNSIRSFYSLNQMSKFAADYEKRHPELKKEGEEQVSIQQIMKQLSIKIEDSGMSKKDAFNFIDFNKNGQISKEEMLEGLKRLGLEVGFIGRVIAVFDRDSSGEVSLEEWHRLLGEDLVMEDVPIPDDIDFSDEDFEADKTAGQKSKPQKKTGKGKQQQEKKNQNKTVKNMTKKNQKQNTNKTQKQTASKGSSQIKNNKGVGNKKFEEDSSLSKNDKTVEKKKQSKGQQQKNSKKEKPQAKPAPKPTPKPESSQPEEREELDAQVDIENTEIEIARTYKKNKKSILRIFERYDKKGKGTVKMMDFDDCLDEIDRNIEEKQKREIFMKNCTDGSSIRYREWLEEISELHAQDVEEQQNDELEREEEEQKHIVQKRQSNKRQIRESPRQPETRPPKEAKEKNIFDHNLIGSIIKRGQNAQQFTELLTVNILSAKDLEKGDKGKQDNQKKEGYKLIDYIDEENQLVKERDKLLEKARSIKSKGQKYKDKDFPPDFKSLITDMGNCQIQNIKLLKWKHYSEIYAKPQLFSGDIQPNDIKQGSLGDCYFLSALACLSQYRNMIQRLFEYYDIDQGYFLIWMCIDGQWRLVEVDGYLPVSPDGKTPAFSRGNQEQLWVLLLEKAYAKCYGNYNNISGGQPFEAIKDLTGAPGEQFNHSKISMGEVWDKLMEANQNQFMMTAGTKMEGSDHQQEGHTEGITSEGVVLGHAYSILDVRVVKRTGQKLLQLRNPWGETEWKGDWSDNSKKWEMEKQFRDSVQFKGASDDGIFWMPLQDFYRNFVCFAINFIRPQYYYESNLRKNVKQFALKIKISQFNTGYFMVSQVDHRHKGLAPNTPYSLCHMIGFIVDGDRLVQKIADKRFLYEREGVIEFKNDPKYPKDAEAIVMVHLEKNADVIVGFYCDRVQADFEIDNQGCVSLLEKLAYLEQNGPTSQTVPNQMKIWLASVQGVGFLCFKNISERELVWNVTIDQPMNLKIIPPTGVKNVLKIQPGETQSLKAMILNSQQGFNFKQKISFPSS